MDTRDSEFHLRLLATFKGEAQDHLHKMAAGLVELEQGATPARQTEVIEAIFREAHSLKGAARAVNLTHIETLCQAVENVFAAWKPQPIKTSPPVFDALHDALNTLGLLLADSATGATARHSLRLTENVQSLKRLAHPASGVSQAVGVPPRAASMAPMVSPSEMMTPPSVEPPILAETVRVPVARLATVLLQAEELLAVKLATGQRATELCALRSTLTTWHRAWATLRPVARQVQRWCEAERSQHGSGAAPLAVQRLLEWVHGQDDILQSLETRLTTLIKAAEHDHKTLGAMAEHLLTNMKQVLMLPFTALLEGFPRLVRDIARSQGKEVEFVMHGGELEIDRRILEEMKDPLMHLVRNCIDHGIEQPAERVQRQKLPRGRIALMITQKDGRSVELRITDDGMGIDAAKVKAAAVRAGVVSPAEAARLSPQDALALVFQSGISTSPFVTDISGRGLGLAIVREKVEKLAGAITLTTQPAAGTTFYIVLPLTLSTVRGLIVRVDDHLLALPTTHVERVLRVRPEAIRTVQNRATIMVRGQAVALVHLAETLQLQPHSTAGVTSGPASAVVLVAAERRLACIVDEVLCEQEMLVKSLGKQLVRVRNIAGATILGTGRVVPILHVPDLMQAALRISALEPRASITPVEEPAPVRHTILVVEDSRTSRTLLKNTLETAGYTVKTAVDGVDACTRLRSETFDLVISDVDMPRMNGFDLTVKIRSDTRLAALPLVLVTALASREDRERSMEVGANGYIVKNTFDQSNLLEVMRRLLYTPESRT